MYVIVAAVRNSSPMRVRLCYLCWEPHQERCNKSNLSLVIRYLANAFVVLRLFENSEQEHESQWTTSIAEAGMRISKVNTWAPGWVSLLYVRMCLSNAFHITICSQVPISSLQVQGTILDIEIGCVNSARFSSGRTETSSPYSHTCTFLKSVRAGADPRG